MSKERIEQINKKISMLHEHENEWNKEQVNIGKQMSKLLIRKKKLAKMISNNMKYCNSLLAEKAALKN